MLAAVYPKHKIMLRRIEKMAYLQRKVDQCLGNWLRDPDKKPHIIKGARQIGKTESIRCFASDRFSFCSAYSL